MINGQKIFTSLASYADYIWLAGRTDPDAPKHKGISIFLVPTDRPGFSTRRSHDGERRTYNTFYDDVRVPGRRRRRREQRLDLITNQLNHERVSLAPPGMVERCSTRCVAGRRTRSSPTAGA